MSLQTVLPRMAFLAFLLVIRSTVNSGTSTGGVCEIKMVGPFTDKDWFLLICNVSAVDSRNPRNYNWWFTNTSTSPSTTESIKSINISQIDNASMINVTLYNNSQGIYTCAISSNCTFWYSITCSNVHPNRQRCQVISPSHQYTQNVSDPRDIVYLDKHSNYTAPVCAGKSLSEASVTFLGLNDPINCQTSRATTNTSSTPPYQNTPTTSAYSSRADPLSSGPSPVIYFTTRCYQKSASTVPASNPFDLSSNLTAFSSQTPTTSSQTRTERSQVRAARSETRITSLQAAETYTQMTAASALPSTTTIQNSATRNSQNTTETSLVYTLSSHINNSSSQANNSSSQPPTTSSQANNSSSQPPATSSQPPATSSQANNSKSQPPTTPTSYPNTSSAPSPVTKAQYKNPISQVPTDNSATTDSTPPPAYHPPASAEPISIVTKKCQYYCYQPDNSNGVLLEFTNFDKDCVGIYIVNVPSCVETSIYVTLKEECMEAITTPKDWSESLEDNESANAQYRRMGIGLGVSILILVVVVVVIVMMCRRRRFLQNPRYPLRTKIVSTISGSKVQLFNNPAYAKEEKSELEEFPRKHIRFLDTIGKGTFGTVVLAEALNLLKKKKGPMSRNWATVAVKMTLISDKSNKELKKDFLCEVALMKTIPPHVNIITLYASCIAHDPYLMILEYAQHGDLRKFLLEHRMERNYANAAFSAYGVSNRKEKHYASAACTLYGADFKKDTFEGNIYAVPGEQRYTNFPTAESEMITSRDLLSFALQISRGLEHLIRNKIVHRDIAARNVLLFEHNIVKISDFGLARKVGQADVYERTRKGLLPIRWMSPESLFFNQFTEKSDVWSYGILLWELITLGSTPYPGLDSVTVLEKIRERDLLTCPPHSATVVNNIVTSCWKEEPGGRPTFSILSQELEQLLEEQVEYVDLDQMNDHEYSTLDVLED